MPARSRSSSRRRPACGSAPGGGASHRKGPQSLRIIGGLWRGRRVSFPDLPGLRPTGDRVRETLFNWLQPWVLGEDCLDLFAGSGACGFESLSRGARSAVFVEAARDATEAIEQNLAILATTPDYQGQAMVARMRAEQWILSQPADQARFGLVFIDPPFITGEQTLLLECCHLLESRGLLKPHARIYVESGAPLPLDIPSTSAAAPDDSAAASDDSAAAPGDKVTTLPANWRPLRQQRAGAVYFGLFERIAAGTRADSNA